MTLLNGKEVAQSIKDKLKVDTQNFVQAGNKAPHLAAILVGDSPASKAYVGSKIRSCEEIGFISTLLKFDETITEAELLDEIKKVNDNDDIDGLIVQLPLPKHIDNDKIIEAQDPKKDVDGFHPISVGKMVAGLPTFLPATPFGILKILEHYNLSALGKNVVILGRSHIVGRPMSILLSQSRPEGNGTVTVCHSRTQNLEEYTKNADIIVAALGIPEFLKANMVKKGVIIIDVGINRVEDASKKKGYKLVGDVAFEEVAPLASYITPVPGGVGLTTIAGLLLNTFQAAQNRANNK